MATITEQMRTAPTRPHSDGSRLVPPGRQRSAPLAVMGVLVCFVGAVLFGALHLRLDHRAAVLALARPVAAGEVIHNGDLRAARVSVGGLATISAAERSSVVGHVAAVSLAPGSLLVRSELGSASTLAVGQAIVGVALKAGQLPGVLHPGDRVLVIDTGSAVATGTSGASSSSGSSRVVGTVAAVSEPTDSPGVTVASIAVAQADAAAIATAAAAGHVSLVLLPSAP